MPDEPEVRPAKKAVPAFFSHLPVAQGEDLKRLEKLLGQKAEQLVSKVDAFNNVAGIFIDAIEKAAEEYATAVREAEDFRHIIHQMMQESYTLQPSRWRHSKEGKLYKLWMMEWGQPLGTSAIGVPSLVQLPPLDEAEKLLALREDP
jgi:hypothetical protein